MNEPDVFEPQDERFYAFIMSHPEEMLYLTQLFRQVFAADVDAVLRSKDEQQKIQQEEGK